jgi:SAM-dependent methyltransferase
VSVESSVAAFVRAHLPPPPARVLEVGAGAGDLARLLRDGGYDVTAIDPASEHDDVVAVALSDVDAAPASFDAAVAVLSLHHVEPLEPSCARLAELVRPGAALVVDELDAGRLDDGAEAWWLEQRRVLGREPPHHTFAELREHLHPLERIHAALDHAFDLAAPVRGPYLYRWDLDHKLRTVEEELIARGELPALGVRFVGIRTRG